MNTKYSLKFKKLTFAIGFCSLLATSLFGKRERLSPVKVSRWQFSKQTNKETKKLKPDCGTSEIIQIPSPQKPLSPVKSPQRLSRKTTKGNKKYIFKFDCEGCEIIAVPISEKQLAQAKSHQETKSVATASLKATDLIENLSKIFKQIKKRYEALTSELIDNVTINSLAKTYIDCPCAKALEDSMLTIFQNKENSIFAKNLTMLNTLYDEIKTEKHSEIYTDEELNTLQYKFKLWCAILLSKCNGLFIENIAKILCDSFNHYYIILSLIGIKENSPQNYKKLKDTVKKEVHVFLTSVNFKIKFLKCFYELAKKPPFEVKEINNQPNKTNNKGIKTSKKQDDKPDIITSG